MSIRILIADDNASVRGAMREVLEGADEWAVIEAENGKEAVEKAQEFRPQLVILDLAMPVMDGLTASREIVKILPGTPILLHTLYSSPEIALEAGKSGVAKIVPKSEASALVSAVHEALHSGTIAALEKSAAVVSSETTSERRRTEDRVRALCMLLLTAKDDKVIEATLVELRDALHQHVEHFRARLAEYPVVSERRVRVADVAQENRTENNVIEMTNGKSEQAEISPNPKVSNG
jgi:NarL family two-component system response regulator LiaR